MKALSGAIWRRLLAPHALTFTAGKAADVAAAANVLSGDEASALGDAGYQGIGERAGMHSSQVRTIAAAMRAGRSGH